jgi:fructose-1,6-bisphosphatase/inositol monophosphatase family enzyme
MTPSSLEKQLSVALAAMNKARQLFLASSSTFLEARLKSDGSDVSDVDLAIESSIVSTIRATYPDDNIVGEEGDYLQVGSNNSWIVDPIDGTAGFVRGVPLSTILIAFAVDERVRLAVIDVPRLGWTFHAVQGGGAYLNGSRIMVCPSFDPQRDIVCHGDLYTFEMAGHAAWYETLAAQVKFFRSYTDAFGHCLVANGSAGLVVDAAMELWDRASVGLLVAEAGGVVIEMPDRNARERRSVIAGSPAAAKWAMHALAIQADDMNFDAP